MTGRRARWRLLAPAILWTLLLAFFFANVEIQIEGAHGWAAALPTWRVEHHWLLDVFWGGRAMTGYHAWVFPFVALSFHFPFFAGLRWNGRRECRIAACVMLFWIAEDFLWFALNPAYGVSRFIPAFIPWHTRWLWHLPVDYWIYGLAAALLFRFSVAPIHQPVTNRR